MEERPFKHNELCSGGHCACKWQCARYMSNVDIPKANNLYMVFNREWLICCEWFLEMPDEGYPVAPDAMARLSRELNEDIG